MLKHYYVFLKAIRPGLFIYDLVTTALTSIVTSVAAIVMIRILAEGLGPDQFAAYLLARRLLTTVATFSTVSMGVAIPRYVAVARDDIDRDSYLLSGIILGIAPSMIVLISGLLFDDRLTLLVFHSSIYRPLFRVTLWLIVGNSIFSVLYAFYRGMKRMELANLLQVTVSAFGPLLVAWAFAQRGCADLIVALVALLMWFAAFPLAFHCRKALGRSGRRLSLKGPLRQLAFYGLPRVPANFALAGLFAVGPFLAPYFGSLKEAGYLAAGQSVLTAIGGGVAAFGLVALPRLAEMAMQGRQETIEEAVEGIITLVLHLGLFAMLQGLLWANEIVLAVLGSQYREVTPLMRVVLLALVPYLAYVMLRSVVDAVEDRAINTANLFLALVVTLVASVIMVTIGWGTLGLAMSTTVGFMTLGASTVFYLMRRYQFKWQGLRLRQVLPLNVGFLVLGVLAKLGLEATLKGALLLPCTAITVIGTAAFYVFILWRLNIGWLVELERRILVHWER